MKLFKRFLLSALIGTFIGALILMALIIITGMIIIILFIVNAAADDSIRQYFLHHCDWTQSKVNHFYTVWVARTFLFSTLVSTIAYFLNIGRLRTEVIVVPSKGAR